MLVDVITEALPSAGVDSAELDIYCEDPEEEAAALSQIKQQAWNRARATLIAELEPTSTFRLLERRGHVRCIDWVNAI